MNGLMMNKKVSNSREVKPKFKVLKNILKLSKVVRDVFSKNFAR